MAKFNFIKKIKKVRKKDQEEAALSGAGEQEQVPLGTQEQAKAPSETEDTEEQKPAVKKITGIIWEKAGDAVDAVDEMCEEAGELAEAGGSGIIEIGAAVINFYDKASAVAEWFVLKSLVISGRKLHDMRIKTAQYRRDIIKDACVLGVACVAMVGAFALATGYEYSYNGRVLGIVQEQSDVLDILDLASEELSQEYGSNIEIDPEEDITFRSVVSYGKEIDSQDDVLRRFTYMSEINAQASAITADGEVIAVVENEEIAQQVLEDVKNLFLSDSDDVEYEYIGFVEDVKIESYSTKLTDITSRSEAVSLISSGGQEAAEYTVVEGDSFYGICEKLGISASELTALNPWFTEDAMIHVGDTLVIERTVPLLTLETVEVTTFAETIPYETEYQDSSYYYEGEEVTSRGGQDGRARITARITRQNGEITAREDLSEEVIIEPVSEIILVGTKKVPPKIGTGTFIRPVNVPISSRYGWRWGRMHYGDDYATSTGTPIKASDGGRVTLAGWYYGYGYTVIINHGGGVQTLYGHCSALYVSAGESVFQGQTIAAVGNTGNSTGPHCHFEIIVNGVHVDPSLYV